ncbi:MAG TPA: sugar ABC transporter ATP-binding protein [Solirubrobacteraceae bacterium]|nr:sugar ABC transporter ATP-binding protein [Solirubrobacteraceae bacterium]
MAAERVGEDSGTAAGGEPILRLIDATKAFGAVHALEGVSLELYGGEVHALVGENGAGKSTLVKILGGVHQPDSGMLVAADGSELVLTDPRDARDAGISIIYQEPTLFPDLTVAENVFIGRQPRRGRRIDHGAMRRQTRVLFERLGIGLDPDRVARGLSIAEQQIVEIAKALSFDARVVVMDEPTAALSAIEVARLFGIVESLRSHGAAVAFISHRLEEVFAICQRVTVLRDGRRVMSQPLEGLSASDLVRTMVGRDIAAREHVAREHGEAVLRVQGLTRAGIFEDISFDVRAGEIVALAGLVGAGRSEVARAAFGIDEYDSGRVSVGDRALRRASPRAAMDAGVAFVPEDRRQQGLVMDLSITDNIALASLRRLRRHGLLSAAVERRFASDWAGRLQVKYGRLANPATSLSGGNQQKVVLAKWLSREPAVLIVDEPTRGIDIATKSEVHRILAESASRGVAVLVISSELPEVLAVADRILVMREGRLQAELIRAEATEETIMAAATGQAHVLAPVLEEDAP